MKKSYGTVLKVILGVFLLFFLIFQIYNTLYDPLTTEMASYFTGYDGISLTGYSIRSDTLLPDSSGGVKSYVAADGEKVAKDSVIVNLYQDASAVSQVGRVEEIEQQLASLKELQSFSETGSADLSIVDAQIEDAYISLLSCTANGQLTDVGDRSARLLELMNKKQVATGQMHDFSERIAALEGEKNTLLSAGATPTASVTAESSGYFVSGWDGYETVLTPDCIDTLVPETLTNIKPTTGGSWLGRIVGDFTWYIAANISFDDSLRFAEGDSLTLRTSLSTVTELPVTVYRINKGETDDMATIVFKCTYMNGELATVRSQPLTAVLNESRGLRISNKAIRIVDGVKGVYILSGSTAKFRTIDILSSDDDYSICRLDDTVDGALSLYDEVIVRGKNLYDGKTIG